MPRKNARIRRYVLVVCLHRPKAPYATLFIDHPATELRVWLWQDVGEQGPGILVWQSNYWTSDVAYPDSLQNPYEDPMGWVSGYSTPAGTRHPWGNGDGRFIYPPEAAAGCNPPEPVLEGPVDIIRWEMLRDGVEDYEYFVILAKLFASRREQIPVTERSVYEGLLEIPDNIRKPDRVHQGSARSKRVVTPLPGPS